MSAKYSGASSCSRFRYATDTSSASAVAMTTRIPRYTPKPSTIESDSPLSSLRRTSRTKTSESIGQRLPRGRVRRLRERGEHVADLVPPTALLLGAGKDVADRLPEPQRPVADREHRGGHAAAFAVAQQISPPTHSIRGTRRTTRPAPWSHRRAPRSSPAGTRCPARGGP